MITSVKRIIISRTDNIGDVVLTLPMAGLLKLQYPHAEIIFLARDYVEAIIDAYPQIDRFVSSDKLLKLKKADAIKQIASLQADLIIHVFPNKTIAKYAKQAKIKHRVGSARRWYHYLYCNHRINFTRAKSNKHEAELNLQLLSVLQQDTSLSTEQLKPFIALKSKHDLPAKWKSLLDLERINIVIHPLSNGNGREWPLDFYLALIKKLPRQDFKIFITGNKREQSCLAEPLIQHCEDVTDLTGKLSLNEFVSFLGAADLYLGSSTGPLHIAAALSTRAVGLYPPAPKLNPERWGPIGENAVVIKADRDCSQCTPEGSSCACMRSIVPDQVQDLLLSYRQ